MVKQTCVKFNKNGTITRKEFRVEDNQIHDGKVRINFTPLCVFPPAKESGAGGFFGKFKFWKWLKSKKSVIYFIEGAINALSFVKGDISLLQTHWTKKESQAYVHKMIVLESMSVKPLKLYQFIILLIVNVIGVAGIFYLISLLMRLG